MCSLKTLSSLMIVAIVAAATGVASAATATLNISDAPLFLTTNAEPLVMLALSNDEQLYHKAYTDFDDVDGDGLIDTTYKDNINYYGYFDSKKCYSYTGDSASGNYFPTASAVGTNSHYCDTASGGGRWSGNFLNWAAMTRMDALRKVLYGGYRSTDTSTLTMLERSYVPSDNHAWSKFYSAADLNKYTPYDIATYTTGITMCNVTPQGGSTDLSQTNTTTPRLRIAKGQWPDWSAQESKQCLWTSEFTPNAANPNASPSDASSADKIDEFTVRVKACDSSLVGAESCKTYGTSLKPVGLLQNFADSDQLKIRFGLITGSYGKRKSGGVLRKNAARFTDEVNTSNGVFTGVDGIVKSINLMRISRYSYSQPGYSGNSPDNCPSGENSWSNGSCSNWGNPMGEIYLEALRYFVGTTPNSNFSSDDTSWIANLNQATWINPYTNTTQAGGAAPYCAKPSILAVSTGVVSFDNDEYSSASDIPGLGGTSGANTQTDTVGASEGINGKNWYVGSLTGGSASDVCTSQTVSSLSSVTGICPEAAGLQGSFKIAGLASFAHQKNTVLQTVGNNNIKPVDTFAVALAPPTPSIKVPVGSTTVTIIPAGYNLRDSNAMQLINFRVISQSADASQGTFFMNFENAPAGSDYDNDMKGFLSYIVSGNTIKIIMYQTGSSSGATQKMGYIIDGVTDAGTSYLLSNSNTFTAQVVASKFFSTTPSDINTACAGAGFASDPTTKANEECHYNVVSTSGGTEDRYMRGVKTHTVGAAATGLLKSPLWYAAKWGGFKDQNNDGIPDPLEWDSDGDGIPDTYFPVTNAGLLGTQLSKALNEIIARVASASSASVNSGSISSDTRLYQARFNSKDWTGQLLAYKINQSDGSLITPFDWDAAAQLPAPSSRQIITTNTDSVTAVPAAFTWSAIGSTRQGQLDSDATIGQNKLNYLRGDASKESATGFRVRPTKLGDIVNSTPLFVGAPIFRYNDSLESKPYSTFKSNNVSRKQMVYAGANDGMLHGFDATTGAEVFGFIPSMVFSNLTNLTSQTYTHQFFVDGPVNMGDAFFASNWQTVLVGGLNKGGQEVYALNITDPTILSSAETNASSIVMWEFTDANDADLGYTYSKPAIVRLHNGKWAAVFGNGYNNTASDAHASSTGNAVLYIVDLQTGALIRKISTGVGTSTDATGTTVPNGLATPAMVDLDGDGIYDYAYAGDLFGNMWKFNLTSTTSSDWDVAFKDTLNKPQPLYQAKDGSGKAQPITERPEVIKGPKGVGMMVLFGTGKYLEAKDKNLSPELDQSFYGIWDKNTACTITTCASTDRVPDRTNATTTTPILTQQTITADSVDTDNNSSTPNVPLRVTSQNPLGANSGWYLDLIPHSGVYQNEKQVSNPVVRNGRVLFTTLIPDSSPCNFGGSSWLMELDALSGSQLTEPAFDVNRDGQVNSSDYPASGMASTDGILTAPAVVDASSASGSKEYIYTPGTSGDVEKTVGNPGKNAYGRQSWRQIK